MVYEEIIEGMTVNMRSVLPSDAEITYDMRMDKEKTRYMHRISGSVEDQRKYIINQNEKEGDYLFLVTDKEDTPIGMRGIYNVNTVSAESGRTIGYGDAFQNIEAIILGIDFAFNVLGVKEIYMDAFADNLSVRGIQKQLGAVEIGQNYIEGWDCASIQSVLYKDVYQIKRKPLIKMIQKHFDRMMKKPYENHD